MITGRSGVDLMFDHATSRVDSLKAAMARFMDEPRNQFRCEEVGDPETGDLVLRVSSIPEVPLEWSVDIGDAVHAARSALDHLAWRLVVQAGGTPGRETCFPVGEQEQGYGDKLRKCLPRVAASTRANVKALGAWRGGDDDLYALDELDRVDKHRLLLPVAAAPDGVMMITAFHGFEGEPPLAEPLRVPLRLRSLERPFPLQVGDEVFRTKSAALASARDLSRAGFSIANTPTFEFVFDHGLLVEGTEVVSRVRTLVEHARDVVEPLVATVA